MANINEIAMRSNDWFESGIATNATATATRAAPGVMRRHLLRDVLITLSGAPTQAGVVTITGGQAAGAGGPTATTVHTIPAGAPQVLLLPVNLLCANDAAVSVSVAALGSGVAASVTVFGFTTSA